MTPEFLHAFGTSLVIGVFGGAALVLTFLYGRRGPMIYPVYAAILFTLGLSLARDTTLGFGERLAAALAGVLVSTLISFTQVVIRAAQTRRELRAAGATFARGHIPRWALPLVLTALFAASAGVAYVSS